MMTLFPAGQIDHLHAPLPFCTHLQPEKVCASFVCWITECTDVLMFSVWFLHFLLKVMTALKITVINVNAYQEMTLSNVSQYWDQMTPINDYD